MATETKKRPPEPDILQALGGRDVLAGRPRSAEEWHSRILDGLPYASLESVMGNYHLTRSEVCETLDLSERTFSRRRNDKRLQPDESDRLFRMARIATMATEVLGDSDRASQWLRRPNRALGGKTPLYLMRTDLGSRQVEGVLGRIEHGVAG